MSNNSDFNMTDEALDKANGFLKKYPWLKYIILTALLGVIASAVLSTYWQFKQ